MSTPTYVETLEAVEHAVWAGLTEWRAVPIEAALKRGIANAIAYDVLAALSVRDVPLTGRHRAPDIP